MSDTAREPIAHLWQHKETGRVYYQGPHDEAPQSTYALIGPLFLEPCAVPPREPTENQREAERYRWLRQCMWWRTDPFAQDVGNMRTGYWQTKLFKKCDGRSLDDAIDAAIAEKEGK